MSKHATGKKISRSHTTLIEPAARIVAQAHKLAEVSKIVLGPITPKLPSGIHRIKCIHILGGLRVEIRGTNSKQLLYIYTSNPASTEATIQSEFKK